MKYFNYLMFILICVIWTAQGFAETRPNAVSVEVQALASKLPGVKPSDIHSTPIPGLYEVLSPPRLFYVSADGNYVLHGDLFDVQRNLNLTRPKRNMARAMAINDLGEQSMIIFEPDKVKHTVSIFTDIDCGYCRKLHSEIVEYNKRGIKVRYLAYPRSGIGTSSYFKAVTVWCSEDRNKALTQAKKGQQLPQKSCDNPVTKHMSLGENLGVRGTPNIILEDGRVARGYVPAPALLKMIEQSQ